MQITTTDQLKVHLKVLKVKMIKQGYTDFQLYPAFCVMYNQNKERYQLSKEEVLNLACEILIEEA